MTRLADRPLGWALRAALAYADSQARHWIAEVRRLRARIAELEGCGPSGTPGGGK